MIEITETSQYPTSIDIKRLQNLLNEPWKKVIIEPGFRGRVSSRARGGELIIGIDPKMPEKIDFGEEQENYPSARGKFIGIRESTGNLVLPLQSKADVALVVAPDPRDSLEIAEDVDELLKLGGLTVVVFDNRSNLRSRVPRAIKELIARFKPPTHTTQIIINATSEDINDITDIEASLNSNFATEAANSTLIIRKESN